MQMVQDLYDGIVHEVLRTGSMRKKGHLVKNWKERFFVLTVNSLKYYETAQSLQEKVQRSPYYYICLAGPSEERVSPGRPCIHLVLLSKCCHGSKGDVLPHFRVKLLLTRILQFVCTANSPDNPEGSA